MSVKTRAIFETFAVVTNAVAVFVVPPKEITVAVDGTMIFSGKFCK